MDASAFWEIIGRYNLNTGVYQIVLLSLLVAGILASYLSNNKWIAKAVLGVLNLFIALFFFLQFGTEPIQKYFALPLFSACAILFFYEAVRHSEDIISRPSVAAIILMVLYAAYPLMSTLLGGRFPQLVTHIMPCPVVTISIAVYSCYKRKNLVLLLLLTIWGLTGVKALIFSAYEDIILLLAGLFGVWLIIQYFYGLQSRKQGRQ
jgi:hypothetical protein